MSDAPKAQPVTRRRYRAPSGDGEILAVPPLPEYRGLAGQNSRQLELSTIHIGGTPLPELRRQARAELFQCITRLRQRWQLPAGSTSTGPLFMTGHQPVLAHPGVWVKNASIHHAAQVAGGTAVNLIVDSDLCSGWSVPLPSGTLDRPSRDQVPFDRTQSARPWEEVAIVDRELFNNCGSRLAAQMQTWGIHCIAADYWASAPSMSTTELVGVFTKFRALQESHWGWTNHEVALSDLSRTPSFFTLLIHIARAATTFRDVYNRAVGEYRQTHRIKNSRHPVPDLRQVDQRIELPYWIWEAGDSQRKPLFVSGGEGHLQLFAEDVFVGEITANTFGTAVEELKQFASRWKIRSRALATTLFARLLLSDLFVHGIGGAKYDEITDRIVTRFFRMTPPVFTTLTATLRLPLGSSVRPASELRELRRRLRDLDHNPERQLELADDDPTVLEKRRLCAAQQAPPTTRYTRRQRRAARHIRRQNHLAFVQCRTALAPQIHALRRNLERQLAVVERQREVQTIVGSREYPAILFPEGQLTSLFDRVARELSGGK